jgi:hypothetical protein
MDSSNPSLEPTEQIAVVQARLHELSAQQPTARAAFDAIVDLVARADGQLPTGARLIRLVTLFNAQRADGVPAIPLGSAGVARACVDAYQRQLLAARPAALDHPALPPDMVDDLNRWLARWIRLSSDRLAQASRIQVQALQASHAEAVAHLTDQIQALQAARDHNALQLQAQHKEHALLLDVHHEMSQRHRELLQALEAQAREQQSLSVALAEARAQLDSQQQAQAALEERLQQALAQSRAHEVQAMLHHDRVQVLEKKAAADKQARTALAHELQEAHALRAHLQAEWEATRQALQHALAQRQATPSQPPRKRRSPPGRALPSTNAP